MFLRNLLSQNILFYSIIGYMHEPAQYLEDPDERKKSTILSPTMQRIEASLNSKGQGWS